MSLTANSTSTLDELDQPGLGRLVITIGMLNLGGTITANSRAYIDKSATVTASTLTLAANSTPTLSSEVSSVRCRSRRASARCRSPARSAGTPRPTSRRTWRSSASSLTVSARLLRTGTYSVLTDLFYVGVGLARRRHRRGEHGDDHRRHAGLHRGTRHRHAHRRPDRIVDVSGDIVVTAVVRRVGQGEDRGRRRQRSWFSVGILAARGDDPRRRRRPTPARTPASRPPTWRSAPRVVSRGHRLGLDDPHAETELITGQVGLLGSGSRRRLEGDGQRQRRRLRRRRSEHRCAPDTGTDVGDVKFIAKSVSTATADGEGWLRCDRHLGVALRDDGHDRRDIVGDRPERPGRHERRHARLGGRRGTSPPRT